MFEVKKAAHPSFAYQANDHAGNRIVRACRGTLMPMSARAGRWCDVPPGVGLRLVSQPVPVRRCPPQGLRKALNDCRFGVDDPPQGKGALNVSGVGAAGEGTWCGSGDEVRPR